MKEKKTAATSWLNEREEKLFSKVIKDIESKTLTEMKRTTAIKYLITHYAKENKIE